jgi:hypothetical protein
MAKIVILGFKGEEYSFVPSRVDRTKLYGSRKRVAVDAEGRTCTKAALSADGSVLISSGMTAQGHFTPEGCWVARSEMVVLDPQGNKLDMRPSTLGVAQPLEGPVAPAELLALELSGVFLLEAEDLSSPLLASLKSGDIYRCPFSYAAALEAETAYIVANDEGVFALVGKRADIAWAQQGAVFVAEQAAEDEADELDFEQL